MIILKRGTEYTPIVFQNSTLTGNYYYILPETYTSSEWVNTENTFLLNKPLDVTQLNRVNVNYNRSQLRYIWFTGGMFRQNMTNDIFVLIVTKNTAGEQYVIVEEEFSNNYSTYFSRIKKSMNALGISSRTKLILWKKEKTYSEFQELLSPSMDDYSTDKQLELSNEFLQSLRPEITPVIDELSDEDILENILQKLQLEQEPVTPHHPFIS